MKGWFWSDEYMVMNIWSITFNRRVVGSTPAIAVTYGPWASRLPAVACALRRETPIQYPCCSRERLWVVEDLKGRYRNGRNEWMNGMDSFMWVCSVGPIIGLVGETFFQKSGNIWRVLLHDLCWTFLKAPDRRCLRSAEQVVFIAPLVRTVTKHNGVLSAVKADQFHIDIIMLCIIVLPFKRSPIASKYNILKVR